MDKAVIDFLLLCESIAEVRAFLTGFTLREKPEPERISGPPPPSPPKVERPKTQLRNRGLQATILRVLYTGAATLKDIHDTTQVDLGLLGGALRVMEGAELIQPLRSAKPGVAPLWALTAEGSTKAKFFVDRPELKIIPGAMSKKKSRP